MNFVGNEREMVWARNYVTAEQMTHNSWRAILDVPALLFAKVGAAVMLNRKRLVTAPFLSDNNTMSYSFGPTWDTKFGYALFEIVYLPSLVQIGALPSYSASDVESMRIARPIEVAEQQQIGAFFERLDQLIALHQRA